MNRFLLQHAQQIDAELNGSRKMLRCQSIPDATSAYLISSK